MHILFFTDNFPPEVNAAATRVYERARYWVEWGHQVTVITCAPNFPQGKVYSGYQNKWYQTEELDGIKVVRVKTFMAKNAGFLLRILDFNSYMIMAVIASWFQKNIDVVVATTPQFFAGLGGYLASLFKRKPFFLEVSDLWPASIAAVGVLSKHSKLYRAIEKVELFLYRRAKKVIVLTSAFKQDLVQRGIEENHVEVVINGVELSRYSPRNKDKELLESLELKNKFVLGYIGTHGMAHDLQNVLQVAKTLQTQEAAVHFLLVGDGAEKPALLDYAEQHQLTNITFVEPKPKAEIPLYWSLCDVALVHLKDSPTFATVIPSKIFEGMAMGLPLLLVAPEGESSKIIETTQAGIHVLTSDQAAFRQAVLKLYQDDRYYQQVKSNALTSVEQYSREKQAQRFIQVLSGIHFE